MISSHHNEKMRTHYCCAPDPYDNERSVNEAQRAVNSGGSDHVDVSQRQSLACSPTIIPSDYPTNDWQGHDYGYRYPPLLPDADAQLRIDNNWRTHQEASAATETFHGQSISVRNSQGLCSERGYPISPHLRSQDPQQMLNKSGRHIRYVDQDDQYLFEHSEERAIPLGIRDVPPYSLWLDGVNPDKSQKMFPAISNVPIGERQSPRSSFEERILGSSSPTLPEPSTSHIESSKAPSLVAPKVRAESSSGRPKRKRSDVEEVDAELEGKLHGAKEKSKVKRQRSGGKNKTREERQYLYQHDHWAKEVTPHGVVCKGCGAGIRLDGRKGNEYYGSGWTKHRADCRGIYFKMEVICLEFGQDFEIEQVDLYDKYWEKEWCTYLVDEEMRNPGRTSVLEPTWLKLNKLAAELATPELTKGGSCGPRIVHYLDESYQPGTYSRGFVKRIPNARARIEAINKNPTGASS